MTNLKTLDDYTKLPDGYTDYDFEQKFEESCKKALESLAKEMIKSRLVTMPKIYVVSSGEISKESLLQGFIKMNPILPNQSSYCVVAYFEPHYKILKRRIKKNDRQRFRTSRKIYDVA